MTPTKTTLYLWFALCLLASAHTASALERASVGGRKSTKAGNGNGSLKTMEKGTIDDLIKEKTMVRMLNHDERRHLRMQMAKQPKKKKKNNMMMMMGMGMGGGNPPPPPPPTPRPSPSPTGMPSAQPTGGETEVPTFNPSSMSEEPTEFPVVDTEFPTYVPTATVRPV